jgi:SAM-dependent methyltransferase
MLTFVRRLLRPLRAMFRGRPAAFEGSASYWKRRYKIGGNSGPGSYGDLALFKAEILNSFVSTENVQSVIEFGCGDGHQLTLAKYPTYSGYDVSPDAVSMCRERFSGDPHKSFLAMASYDRELADVGLSLDVIYHLVEDETFHQYMETLFNSSMKWVVIYSSNFEGPDDDLSSHVRHREFTRWVETRRPDWSLEKKTTNRFPFKGDYKTGSHAEFFFFRRREVS